MAEDVLDRIEALLAAMTPGLATCKIETLAEILRMGAAEQMPRALDWAQVDYKADAAALLGALKAGPALLACARALRKLYAALATDFVAKETIEEAAKALQMLESGK